MTTLLSQGAVSAIDWAVVALCGCMFCMGVFGSVYTLVYSRSLHTRPAAKEFNYLWRARFLSQARTMEEALEVHKQCMP